LLPGKQQIKDLFKRIKFPFRIKKFKFPFKLPKPVALKLPKPVAFKFPKTIVFSVLLIILTAAVFTQFFISGLARRSFVFYSIDSGAVTVEERMLKRAESREQDLVRYVEEALLGPILPNLRPLFPMDTNLRYLMYRDRVVYVDFSEEAALQPAEGGDVLENFKTLNSGIKRNFPFVKEVRFFIIGNAAFYEELKQDAAQSGVRERWF